MAYVNDDYYSGKSILIFRRKIKSCTLMKSKRFYQLRYNKIKKINY